MANSKDVKCVIFDKDGTLVDFHKMWLPWAVDTVRLCEAATKMPVGSAVYKTLGVDPHLGKVSFKLDAKKNPKLKKRLPSPNKANLRSLGIP
ncbi:hypothetical protein WR25_06691 [Diploscapter pachys]|uniref:Uncharacterized protein n=1 Tax=Diploscapter pachys TaxID=2018661 RepID=A0A2A2K0W9_9BILA|nr:hypothetical protein WR25_06691 [Diploscapter pachys]